ncbi:MAG: hypothetical protein B5766_07725 [Candidatus Lumbricidophila eiseniae]|uniref:ATP-binding protein n=1 Tax=Candidatus Lumbricidiphila eiseniae TaxID=1969409 RepID=A0A2A6FR91_9MICO|nr:MAG: hypothetical protein B5766_07725 [Candidatus Lumbricidophila eiseniae]
MSSDQPVVSTVGLRPATETRAQRKARLDEEAHARRVVGSQKHSGALPGASIPKAGVKSVGSWRGIGGVFPPAHRASSVILQTAYPWLASSGTRIPGVVFGEDVFSRSPFGFDPWAAYAANKVRSFDIAVFGLKGTGKSEFSKVFANRLIAVGVRVAIPNDPKFEWRALADKVDGAVVVSVGPGSVERINLLDASPRRAGVSDRSHLQQTMQHRRSILRQVVQLLRADDTDSGLESVEHTALDLALEAAIFQTDTPTVRDVLHTLEFPDPDAARLVGNGGLNLFHTLRRLTSGDVAGMFDTYSTVAFNTEAPCVVVDTSGLRTASKEAQAITTLATSTWIKQAVLHEKVPRLLVHEEAAIAFLADVSSGGEALADKTVQEKLGRDSNISNMYLMHRLSDMDALGDEGSKLRAQALGLLQDTDTKIFFGQAKETVEPLQQFFGLNSVEALLTQNFMPGDALFRVGREEPVVVAITPTPEEHYTFKTDTVERSL